MKATPRVAKVTLPAQNLSMSAPNSVPREEAPELSPEKLRARAFSSTDVLDEILNHDGHSHSFRHWGINE